MKLHFINHGDIVQAKLLTELDGDEACAQFNKLADKCFGLRKNNYGASIIHTEEVGKLSAVIEHNGGDLIIFDENGEKVRDEWDDWGDDVKKKKEG